MRAAPWTYRIIVTLAFICVYLCGAGQDTTSSASRHHIETSELSDLKDLVKYEKTTRKLLPKKQKKRKKRRDIDLPSTSVNLGGLGILIRYLFYLVILILVLAILFMIFSNVNLERKIDIAPVDIGDIEDIETIDAKSGLELALEANNYREAVRMLFIQLLQLLVTEDHIEWQPKKTNRDYQREMVRHPKITHFRNLVMAYERVWYGSQEIDRPYFDVLRRDFEQFYSTSHVNVDHE